MLKVYRRKSYKLQLHTYFFPHRPFIITNLDIKSILKFFKVLNKNG